MMDAILATVYEVVGADDKFGFLNRAGKFRVMLPDGSIYRSNRNFTSATKLVYVYREGKWFTDKGSPAKLLDDMIPTLKRALKRMQKQKVNKKSFKIKLPKKAKPTKEKLPRLDKNQSYKTKRPFVESKKVAGSLVKHLKSLGFKGIVVAGSIRRKEEMVGDIDVMAIGNLKSTMTYKEFTFIKGREKSVTFLYEDHQVNLYSYLPKYYGSMLMFLTGPGPYNIALRVLAKKLGFKLSQYGLENVKTGKVYSKTEEEIYKQLGKSYKPPELRGKKGVTKTKVKIEWGKLDDESHPIKDIKKYIKGLSEKQLEEIIRKAKKTYYNK